jgi:acetyl esterase/lipase
MRRGCTQLFIVVGGAKALLDDAVRLARAGIAGTGVTLTSVAGMQHPFPVSFGFLPETNAAMRAIGHRVRSRTG